MDKIILEDEMPDENIEKSKKKKKLSKKSKTKDKKHLRSESHNALSIVGKQKTSENLKAPKLLSEKTLPQKNCEKKNNIGKLNLYVDKTKVSKLSLINSTYSNIQTKEPLNLIVNKNDSFINSIINEMAKIKN